MSGKIVHFEIPFDDGERARGFYREVFGWNVVELPEMNYTTVATGPTTEQGMPAEPGFINGGMFDRAGAAPKSPVITIDVPGIDATLAKIEQLGGAKLVGRTEIPNMGYYAYFTDTEGNVVGLWETLPRG
ncbi:VOC family protein [Amycolatopsis sp. K13G38]|uniref:VOC family protein n=1 Tax=Amycolatopsis acididurans TaxID=2724524 RepID=A0ABX1JHL7_9PSEU|nr:VOC family protein [Amycolatopsis acididurans]NKQ58314.1 VOC family protein [Amycolatopsis acididurans]